MKYFRVKWGYGKDEFYTVDETEVRAALTAQATGGIAAFKAGTIAGNSIIAVMPDFNTLMGYNRDYQLSGEDYRLIGAKVVEEHRLFIENTKLALEGKPPLALPPDIQDSVKQLAREKSEPTFDR